MSRLLSCNALVDAALREIGTFSPYDVSADPDQHEIGLERLDLLTAELGGVENLWFLRPSRQMVAIPASLANFSLTGLLSPALQFFDDARLILPESPTLEQPLQFLKRSEYDAIGNKSETGDPRCILIDRTDTPTVSLWPTADRTGLQLILDGQAYASTATDNLGKNQTGFPAAWQRHLIKRLAVDLGSGPVCNLPVDQRQQKQGEADKALSLLLPRNNRENDNRTRRVALWDPIHGSRTGARPRRNYGTW